MKDFVKIKNMIHEYDEIEKFLSKLRNDNCDVGIIDSSYDGPGLNYTIYSNNIKDLITLALINAKNKIENKLVV